MKVKIILYYSFLTVNLVFAQLFSGPFNFSVDQSNSNVSISSKIPSNHYLYSEKFYVTDSENKKIEFKNYPATKIITDPDGNDVKVIDKDFKIFFENKLGNDEIYINYQGCNDQSCFFPSITNISLSTLVYDNGKVFKGSLKDLPAFQKRISGYLTPKQFINFLENNDEEESIDFITDPFDFFMKSGIILSSLLIILGGFALNLTPCVLPMIPINIAIIGAGVNAQTKKHGFLLGALYGSGITFAYGLLGVLVILTGSQFGSLNSSPWFNLFLSIIFLILALAMFGIFNIDFSAFQQKFSEKDTSKISIIFVMGALSGLLAGACVAPVVIAVLILSSDLYLSGSSVGLFLPFLLGLGMALPWPFVGSGLSFLPKPGKWMQIVKNIFGIFILVFCIKFMVTAISGFNYSNKSLTISSKQELELAIENSLIDDKPVIIDFWAHWCKSCKELDKTLNDKLVQQKLSKYTFLKFDASKIDEVEDVLIDYDILGLPTIVVIYPSTN